MTTGGGKLPRMAKTEGHMTQHYTRNTKQVSHYCRTCGRNTMHRVDDRRLGPCLEHSPEGLSKAQEKAAKERKEREQNPTLF